MGNELELFNFGLARRGAAPGAGGMEAGCLAVWRGGWQTGRLARPAHAGPGAWTRAGAWLGLASQVWLWVSSVGG